MESILQQFEHERFGKLRLLMRDGEPYVVAADVARVLGYSRAGDMAKRLEPDERETIVIEDGERVVLSKTGFYHVCAGSDSELARPLSRWVANTCIPLLREGSCAATDEATTAVMEAKAAIDRALELVSKLGPKVRIADAVAGFVTGLVLDDGAVA